MLSILYLIIFPPRDCPILVSVPFLIGFFFKMPFSRAVQQADFASLEPLLSVLWEGCCQPATSFLSLHVLIHLSWESVLKSAVNRSRVPLASESSYQPWKRILEGAAGEPWQCRILSLVPVFLFQTCPKAASFLRGWCWLRDAVLIWGIAAFVRSSGRSISFAF